ncbi:MAG: dTDP-4-dehydrorhamnose 3,5-epimerase [Acidobacteriota bacterium]|nr:dTDP-4-dehydrorhamnose 3,5-epimerase [Blastocatellia bacterium]MDW8240034.1 dTDP-4-dehydrorhamnose 3,5-epimerase [Acidobacteriota bacterium]
MPFEFQQLDIPDVILIQSQRFSDARGAFAETYKRSEFAAHGIPEFVQDNLSQSVRNVVRGLHYQSPPRAQGKLVMALRGEVFDVAVDIRRGSPTFGRWVGVRLSSEPLTMLYIPAGFAHGYCALSDEADVLYKVTDEYTPELDRGILWNDPDIGIRWPVQHPILSAKDERLPRLKDADIPFFYDPPSI